MDAQEVVEPRVDPDAWRRAVKEGDVAAVEEMLAKDARLVREKVESVYPVYMAARNGHAALISLLLKHGAQASGIDPEQEGRRFNSLLVAIKNGHTDAVEVLLREGEVDPNSRVDQTAAVLWAAHHHHPQIIQLLDQYGADMHVKSADGKNALTEACTWTSHPALIESLLERGIACDVQDSHGMTPILYLATIGDVDSLRMLVEKGGANLAHVNPNDGSTALSIAERRKFSEIIKYCWKRGMAPSSLTLSCHLGELHVSRPRIRNPIGGRYHAATIAVGSKIFTYGGHATKSSTPTPIVKGLDASEDLLSTPSPTPGESAPHDDDQNAPNVANVDEDDDGEDDGDDGPHAAALNHAFQQYLQQLQQALEDTGEAPPPEQELINEFIRRIMQGEIVLRENNVAGEARGDDHDATPPPASDHDSNVNPPSLDDHEEHKGNEYSLDDDGDSVGSAAEADYDSDDGTHSSTVSFDTHVLDLDDCKMESIFRNPHVQRRMKLITLDETKMGRWMRVAPGGLSGGTINPPADASFPPCLAFGTKSFNEKRGPFGYFELHVINPGPRRLLTMGLVPSGYPTEGRQPGWDAGSFGLHGDDGSVFCQAGHGDAFADRFEAGDVIGCGVYWPTREVFFAVNGRFIGFADSKARPRRLYACVAVRNENAEFRVNFGLDPFRFDFRAPTVSWSKLSLFNPTLAPKLRSPYFFKEASGKYLVLCAPATTRDVHLFNIQKMAYSKRSTKGELPAPIQSQSELMSAQPDPRFAFLFLPRSENQPPSLGLLDTLRLEWHDLTSTKASPEPSSTPQCEFAQDWQALIAALDQPEFTINRCWFTTVYGKLVWTSNESFIVADPVTGMFSQQSLASNSAPRITKAASHVSIGDSTIAFAGWDGKSQRNDIAVFTLERGEWYTPTSTGVIPRPRSAHSGFLAHTKCAYFGPNAADLPSGLILPESEPVVVNAFGWSGNKTMGDLDIFFFSTAPSQHAISIDFPSDFTVQVSTLSGATSSLPAHRILLYCRSSKFHKMLTDDPTSTSVNASAESIESFQGLIHFLYTDALLRDPAWIAAHSRALAKLVDEWAPELSPRLLERLLLNRTTIPNIFGTQMQRGFNNPLFHDLILEATDPSLGPSTAPTQIFVHKVVLISRSLYFKAMFTGGMAEASQNLLRVDDAPVEALKLVIEFLYTYEVPYDRCAEYVVDMFILASRFQVSKLKSTLENLLIFNLSLDNVVGLVLTAYSYSSKNLLSECLAFIEAHKAKLRDQPDFVEYSDQIAAIKLSLTAAK